MLKVIVSDDTEIKREIRVRNIDLTLSTTTKQKNKKT